VHCRTHRGGRYTVYPPGHLPYGRAAVVPCSPEGPLRRPRAGGPPVWAATLFGAALDAAAGSWWPADSPAGDDRRRRTQGRRLAWAECLLGLDPALPAARREQLATRLQVPALTLLTHRRTAAASWQARGQAVRTVLAALPVDAGLLDRVLAAGAVSRLWPHPRRWDRRAGAWLPTRPRAPKRPGATPASSRPPPPTTSQLTPPAGGP
jgi:hypothetical protein